jgi:hypothetical protein
VGGEAELSDRVEKGFPLTGNVVLVFQVLESRDLLFGTEEVSVVDFGTRQSVVDGVFVGGELLDLPLEVVIQIPESLLLGFDPVEFRTYSTAEEALKSMGYFL